MATIEEMYTNVTFAEVYESWQTFARRTMILSAYERDYSEEEFEKAVWDTHAMLRKLAAHIIEMAGVRDELIQPKEILIAPMDQRGFIDSKKMDLRFEVCADGHVTWLESRIIYPQHLRRMDDEFFELLIGLRQFGAWKFDSLNGPDKNIKSSVYQLVVDAQAEDLSDFGAFVVGWPHEATADELLRLAPRAFAILHQLQYRLYRAEYQLRAGRKRK
jgi:hypothetical protein